MSADPESEARAPMAALAEPLGVVLGSLKLVKEEYVDAVREGVVIDAIELAESELFHQRTTRKWRRVADAVLAIDPGVHAVVEASLAALGPLIAAKGPVAREEALVDDAVGAIEALLAGAGEVPPAIRGVREAVSAADAAILTELVQDEYRIGLAVTEAQVQHMPARRVRMASEPPPAASHYLMVVLRERRTKRPLPRSTVTIQVRETPSPTVLTETWDPFHHYGANFRLPKNGSIAIGIEAKPPEYNRHGDCLVHHVTGTSLRIRATLSNGVLTIPNGQSPGPVDDDWGIGDDVLQARAEALQLVGAGPYEVGFIAEAPEPIWRWTDAGPDPKPLTDAHTNHLEVVLFERATGRMVTGAGVTLLLKPPTGQALAFPLLPLMSVFNHYGDTVTVPPGRYAVSAEIKAPTFATLAAGRLQGTVRATFPEPWVQPAKDAVPAP